MIEPPLSDDSRSSCASVGNNLHALLRIHRFAYMRRLSLAALILALLTVACAAFAQVTGVPISGLPAVTGSPAPNDVLPIVDILASPITTKKITITQMTKPWLWNCASSAECVANLAYALSLNNGIVLTGGYFNSSAWSASSAFCTDASKNAITSSCGAALLAAIGTVPIANGGTGTNAPICGVAGTNTTVTGTFPNTCSWSSSVGAGSITNTQLASGAALANFISSSSVTPTAEGGTGTGLPTCGVAGTNTTVTGTFPNSCSWSSSAGTLTPATFSTAHVTTNALVSVCSAACIIYGIEAANSTAATCFLQGFNVASGSVTLGTTVPDYVLILQATAQGAGAPPPTEGANYGTAFSYAMTTTRTGSTTCGSTLDVTIYHS